MFETMVFTIMVMILGCVCVTILGTLTKERRLRRLFSTARCIMATVAGTTIAWFEFMMANPFIQTPFLAIMLLVLAPSIMLFFSNLMYAILRDIREKMR